VEGVWTLLAPRITLGVIAATASVVLIMLLFNEQSKSGIMRFLGLILLMAGNLISILWGAELLYYAVGTAIYFSGGFILMLATLRNSIIL